MKRLLFFLCFVLLLPVRAIDDDDILVDSTLYPSYALVQETHIPPIDRVDLARRFLGVDYEVTPAPTTPVRQMGDIKAFYISTYSAIGLIEVDFELRAIGEHVYVWLEHDVLSSPETLQSLVERFDTEVYEFVRSLWGSEAIPGIDGEERIHIMISQQIPQNIGGYFSSRNSSSVAITPYSNELDMLVLNAQILSPQFQHKVISIAAHEFQHMIRMNIDFNEINWLDEGFSSFTEHVLGYGAADFKIFAFAGLPSTSLNSFGHSNNFAAEYGASALFTIYLYDRFGMEFLQTLSGDSDSGMIAVNNTLETFDAPPVDIVFADWVLANYLQQENSLYGYQSVPNLPSMMLADAIQYDYPFTTIRRIGQYSTDYFRLANLPSSLTISLSMPDTVGLIGTRANSGQMMWYSQRGDNSNPRLTRKFDLRGVDSAQLDYRIWYDLETDWDYAYLSASADDGATWQVLSTPNMTVSNPNGRAYGIGYTGQSQKWLEQSVSLDDFVGKDVLLRFEMVTDDGVNHAGVALDDLWIEAIGYQSDFETDGGGWQPEGWILTDNRLPQRAWVQVVEHQGNDSIVTRYLAHGDESWTLNLSPETDMLTLAISLFAPMTTESVAYELVIK